MERRVSCSMGLVCLNPLIFPRRCIMLELFCKKPVFQGNDEIHQLDVIYKILGTPTPEEWPGVTDMPWYELVKPRETLRNRFRELFNRYVRSFLDLFSSIFILETHRWLSPSALDLAERLLSYDPEQRATADQALEAAYFSQEPAPVFPVGYVSVVLQIIKNPDLCLQTRIAGR